MSDDREQLIDLDATRTDAAARAEALRGWLTASGWIGQQYPETYWDSHDAPEWELGPRALAKFPSFHRASIAITGNEGVWSVDANPLPPICPQCEEAFTFDEYYGELLEPWATTGVEPVGICSNCGYTAPFGDWIVENTVLGGSLGLSIDFTSPDTAGSQLALVLLAELREAIGGRWVYTHMHL